MKNKIKPEDLRKGNCVIGFNNSGPGIIDEIKRSPSCERDYGYIAFFKPTPLNAKKQMFHFGNGYIEDFTPIEITKDILIDVCGAVLTKNNGYNVDGILIHEKNGVFTEYVHQIELKGLHHLQNVFYFTRQKELNINI